MNNNIKIIIKDVIKEIIRAFILIIYFFGVMYLTQYSKDRYLLIYGSKSSESIINENNISWIYLLILVFIIFMQTVIFFCEKEKAKKIVAILLMIPPILIFIFQVILG